MKHQLEEEKLTIMAVHTWKSHPEKPTRQEFVITNNQGPNQNLQERRLQTTGTQTAEISHFLFQINKMYNLNKEESAHAFLSGKWPSHMKEKIGWSQESSEYADGLLSSHFMCSLYGRFKSLLKL